MYALYACVHLALWTLKFCVEVFMLHVLQDTIPLLEIFWVHLQQHQEPSTGNIFQFPENEKSPPVFGKTEQNKQQQNKKTKNKYNSNNKTTHTHTHTHTHIHTLKALKIMQM